VRVATTSPDGIPIAFDVEGSGDPCLVFVHGWSCDRSYWVNQMRSFAPRHRVVAIDLAGHGESGSGRASWTMPAFGGDVAAVARRIGADDVILVGHSMGGDVIVDAALQLGGRVRGLVWIDVYSDLDRDDAAERAWVDRFVAGLGGDFRAEVDRFVRGMFPPDADPALVDRVAGDMASAPPDIAIDCLRHAKRNLGPALAGLSVLRLPVVSIHPAGSGIDEASMLRAGVQPVSLDGVGHFPMLEAPERFSALLAEVIASFG
jgi:pimeloyl-ACP methyl ester carboxylesterase